MQPRMRKLIYVVEAAAVAAAVWFFVIDAPRRAAQAPTAPPEVVATAPGAAPAAPDAPAVVAPTAAPGETAPPAPRPALPLPTPEATQVEIHGTWRGQRFWARLKPAEERFGGHRQLQLLYTPPTPEELGGTVLVPHPDLLVDANLRLVAWNERGEALSGIKPNPKPPGYKIRREIHAAGDDIGATLKERSVGTPPAWDHRLAPLLLALSWSEGTSARIRLLDFYGPRAGEALELSWTPQGVQWAGVALTAKPDAAGKLAKLVDAMGMVVLVVEGRK